MEKSQMLEVDVSRNIDQPVDSPGFENASFVSFLSHVDANLLPSFDVSSVKNDVHEDKFSDKFNTSLNNLKERHDLNSTLDSIYHFTNAVKSRSNDSDCKNFTHDSSTLVASKVLPFNKDFVGESCASSFIKDLSINNLHDSYLDNSSEGTSPIKFVCLKCGLGFPCTVFVCRRGDSSCDTQVSKLVDDSILQTKSFNDHFATSKSKGTFTYQKTVLNSPKIKQKFLNEQKSFSISNKESSSPNYKMQCKNDLKKLSQECNLSKNTTNISILGDACTPASLFASKVQYDDSALKSPSFRNLFSPSRINSVGKLSSDLPIESLSQGTRNFLNELAASNATKISSESGYALSTINSPFSKRNKKNEILLDSNESRTGSACIDASISNESASILNDSSVSENKGDVSLSNNTSLPLVSEKDISVNIGEGIISDTKNMPILNDQVVSVLESEPVSVEENVSASNDLNNIADTKDVVNALDLIEQSSMHDREMSSAEICSSLNQIFSESNIVFSTSAESNPDNSQVTEMGTDYETITFQAVDSNNENITNLDTNTINLADLYSSGNSEFCQQILLVQDESGNIETVLLLPQDAQVVESVPSNEASTSDTLQVAGNNAEYVSQEGKPPKDQCVFVNDVSADKMPNDVENDLIMHNSAEDQHVSTIDSKNEQQYESNIEDSVMQAEVSSPQQNFVTEHNILETKSQEENVPTDKHLEECMHVAKDIDFVNVPQSHDSIDKISNNTDKNEILSSSQISANIQNDQQFLIHHQNSVNNSIDMQTMVSTTLKRGCDEISSASKDDFDDNEICIIKEMSSSLSNSVNKQERKLDMNIVVNSYSHSSNKNNEMVTNKSVSAGDSNTLNNKFSSKAKKRLSINGASYLKPIQFDQHMPFSNNVMNIKPCETSSPLNGAVYSSQSTSNFVENHQDSNTTNIRHFIQSEILKVKPVQKSKKTIVPKLSNRTAKKTVSVSNESDDLVQIYHLLKNSDTELLNKIFEDEENYIKAKNMLLKRGMKDDVIDYLLKRKTNSSCESKTSSETVHFNGVSKAKSRTVALKTFVKPFTAAKKSIFDYKKNTALKTCISGQHLKKNTALKSCHQKNVGSKDDSSRSGVQKKINSILQNQQNPYTMSNSFQPEICEIKILPNEYVKRASDVLLKTNSAERPYTPEENVSEEEIKISPTCSSPMEELMLPKFRCVCVEKEIPCLCYNNNLQQICEAEDSFDDKIIPCTNPVSQHYLSTPSSQIKHRAFCDMHIWRLRQHHCCPKCGIFCSQGDFLLCLFENLEKTENHLFHLSCFIIPSSGLPPGCPHCCQLSSFSTVNLIYKSAIDDDQKEVPSNAQNITREISDCDVYMRVKEVITPTQSLDSDMYTPQKNMIEMMIRSLAKKNSLRLRPTAKCLYNPIRTGDVQKVMQLIGNGVNPNHKFRMQGNNAPLHVAAHYGWTGILHILIQAGAFIDSVNDDLETPLIVAVEKNQLPIVRYLILAGAQIDVKDCNGMTSFHIASKNGFKDIAQVLYDTGNIDINLQDDGGWTALVWACEHKHVEFVQWLLEIGADPNVRDNEGNTVLHWAAYSGKYEIAQLLLDKGCTLSCVNKRGDSALHIAAREDNYECVKLFINRGAVLDQKNKENKTPLMCCQDDSLSFNYLCQSISSGALKVGKLLLEKHVVFRDISRGAEAYPIQAVNEVDDEEFIMEFRYVVKHCYRSGVNIVSTVDSMQFCYCKDNCVTRDCNCTMNSKCWYDANGCLKTEYDLQSLPVIFECNKTCHCPKTCINRVVQQGLRFPLQIFRTRYKGWGVRALQDIPRGAFVCEYVGELITGTEATQRNDDTYLFDLESQGSDYCLDGRYFGNVARFLNHSCEPNLIALKVFVDHQDMNFPRIAFFAYREIQAFEELCFDYGLDFWIVKCQTVLCVCNTRSCKYSKDTIDDTLLRFFKDTEDGEQLSCES